MTRKFWGHSLAILTLVSFLWGCSSNPENVDAGATEAADEFLGDEGSGDLVGDLGGEEFGGEFDDFAAEGDLGGEDFAMDATGDSGTSDTTEGGDGFEEFEEFGDFGSDNGDMATSGDLDQGLVEEELGGLDEDFTTPSGLDTGATGFAGADLAQIRDLRYVAFQQGGTIVIEADRPLEYQLRNAPERNQIVVEVPNAQLPESLKRPYITKDFKQDIASIQAYQNPGATTARFVIQLKRPLEAQVTPDGNSLRVVTSPGGYPGTAIADASGASATALMEQDIQGELGQEFAQASPMPAPVQETGGALSSEDMRNRSLEGLAHDSTHFYGEPISIEVTDADIRDIFNMIAEQVGLNLVIDEEVKGLTTLKLREVPWDQALVILMKSKDLSYTREGNVLRIAPVATLQKEDENRRKEREAKELGEALKVKVIPVSYAKVKDLEPKVKEFLSQRGKVAADERTSSLIVTDIEDFLDRISRLVKSLDIPPLQVLIEGKIIEAREAFSREFGVNFGIAGTNFEIGDGAALTGGLNSTPLGPTIPVDGMNISLTAGAFDTIGNLNALLSIYERDQKIRVLSSPRIVTLNNQKADIRQITQIPIMQIAPATEGSDIPLATVTFRDLTLLLEVEPQITFEGNVILQVKVLREFAGAAINQQTGAREINSRQANTKVLVRNGQTAVIGGIYQSDALAAETGIPWLRNIPILGNLFKKTESRSEKNELLIFLTPRVLNAQQPAAADDMDGGGATL